MTEKFPKSIQRLQTSRLSIKIPPTIPAIRRCVGDLPCHLMDGAFLPIFVADVPIRQHNCPTL
jgi:hypothetical protein